MSAKSKDGSEAESEASCQNLPSKADRSDLEEQRTRLEIPNLDPPFHRLRWWCFERTIVGLVEKQPQRRRTGRRKRNWQGRLEDFLHRKVCRTDSKDRDRGQLRIFASSILRSRHVPLARLPSFCLPIKSQTTSNPISILTSSFLVQTLTFMELHCPARTRWLLSRPERPDLPLEGMSLRKGVRFSVQRPEGGDVVW